MKNKIAASLTLSIISLASMANSIASTLPRSAFLGVIPTSTAANAGVEVRGLHPDGTGNELGLKPGDKILTINNSKIDDFSALVEQLRRARAGEKVSVNVMRDGKKIELSANAVDRPREQGKGFNVKYGSLDWNKEKIRTISYEPQKPRKDGAAVFFIQGYTCDSIDYGMLPQLSLSQMLASYAQAGYYVFKMEKPGVGDSVGELDCYQYDFGTENKAFKAGLSHLKQQSGVNNENVFVFGHSLGVLHAAMLAEEGSVKGAIGYGGVVKSWLDYTVDIYTKQSVLYWGTPQRQADNNLATVKPFLDLWLDSDESWDNILSNKKVASIVNANLVPINGDQVFHRHYSFFRSLNQIDFEDKWRNTNAHTLMLHGNYDIQAIDGKWANQIASMTNERDSLVGQALFFDNTDHSLMKYPNKEELMKGTRRDPDNKGVYNADIATASIKWMNEILN